VARLNGRQNGGGGVDAGEQVGQCYAHALWPATGHTVGATGDAHHAAHGLNHQVVAGALGVRSVLAKAGDGAVDQLRVERAQARMVQPVSLQAADLEVLHQHIALQHHLAHQGLTIRVRQVERDGALVAVGARKVAGLIGIVPLRVLQERRPPVARVVAHAGTLDLYDVGT
jgi:hypothetical protein